MPADPTPIPLSDEAVRAIAARAEAANAACDECARSCACRFPDAQGPGPHDPLGECAYHRALHARVPSAEAVKAVRAFVACYTREVAGRRSPRNTAIVEDALRAHWPSAWGAWPGGEA